MTNETVTIQEIEALPAGIKALVSQAFVGMVDYAGAEERAQAAKLFGEVEALSDIVTDSIAEDLRSEIADLPSEVRDQPEIRAISAQLASGKLAGVSASGIRSAIESARATAEADRHHQHAEEAALHELRMKRDALIDQHFHDPELNAYVKEQIAIAENPNSDPAAVAQAKGNIRNAATAAGVPADKVDEIIDQTDEIRSREERSLAPRPEVVRASASENAPAAPQLNETREIFEVQHVAELPSGPSSPAASGLGMTGISFGRV